MISPTVTLPGLRRRLEARGDVDRVAHHRVAVADLAGQHVAGVDPDPQREAAAGGGGDVLVDLLHRGLHRQAGADGTLGVVLVGDRRTEHRHHVVADVLVDGAAVADDLLPEPAQRPVDDRLHGLGVHALGDRRVAEQVGEQHRRLAALLRQTAGGRAPGGRGNARELAAEQRAAAEARPCPAPPPRGSGAAGAPSPGEAPPRLIRPPRAPSRTRCRTSRRAGSGCSQLGQVDDSAAPHDMQKRARSGLSVPQLGQAPPPTSRTIRRAITRAG